MKEGLLSYMYVWHERNILILKLLEYSNINRDCSFWPHLLFTLNLSGVVSSGLVALSHEAARLVYVRVSKHLHNLNRRTNCL